MEAELVPNWVPRIAEPKVISRTEKEAGIESRATTGGAQGTCYGASDSAAAGRSQRSEGTEEIEPQLSLGTSWCWEQASQGNIPFHRWAGLLAGRAQGPGNSAPAGILGPCDSCSLCCPRGFHISPAFLPRSSEGHSRESRAASTE